MSNSPELALVVVVGRLNSTDIAIFSSARSPDSYLFCLLSYFGLFWGRYCELISLFANLIPGLGCSLNFLEDQGIDLIRPPAELADIQRQANSSMSEAEVLSALQVSISAANHTRVVTMLLIVVSFLLLCGQCAMRLWIFLTVLGFELLILEKTLSCFLCAQVILSSQYYPLHVMCNFGHQRTGIFQIVCT